MRRRRSSLKKEKVIMLASSALVLTALTATGLYVRNSREQEQDGYMVDFTALEDGADELADTGELDYDPSFTEANSGNVDNPGLNMLGSMASELTDQAGAGDQTAGDQAAAVGEEQASAQMAAGEAANAQADAQNADRPADGGEQEAREDGNTSVAASSSGVESRTGGEEDREKNEEEDKKEEDAMSTLPPLDFTEQDVLVWPIVGNVLVNYSMDKTVYFATLQQYKYSPAIVISAVQGEGITAAADGQVSRVYTDPEIGTAVVMDLGDGYELTYGQLTDLTVSEGDYVTCGEIIGKVAAPTKYYSVEGCNVYFKLTKDGQPVNPLNRLS